MVLHRLASGGMVLHHMASVASDGTVLHWMASYGTDGTGGMGKHQAFGSPLPMSENKETERGTTGPLVQTLGLWSPLTYE